MTHDRSCSVRVLERLLTLLLVALGICLGAGTTPANSATFSYDAFLAAPAVAPDARGTEARAVDGIEGRKETASAPTLAAGASTTLPHAYLCCHKHG